MEGWRGGEWGRDRISCEMKESSCAAALAGTKLMLKGISRSLKVGSSLMKLFSLASELLGREEGFHCLPSSSGYSGQLTFPWRRGESPPASRGSVMRGMSHSLRGCH